MLQPKSYFVEMTGKPKLHVLHLPAIAHCDKSIPVLYIHGATFPSDTSVAFRMNGKSWMDELSRGCFSVWALDFAGYGKSDRYTEGNRVANPELVPGRMAEVMPQIERAVDFILSREVAKKVSIIAHSWGTIPAGYFATTHPSKVERLLLFGPIAQRTTIKQAPVFSSNQLITVKAQHDRFVVDTPDGHVSVLSEQDFIAWGAAYLASEPNGKELQPAAVLVPNGPSADIADAWAGLFPYDPSGVTAPVMVVHGEWDSLSTPGDVEWLLGAFRSAKNKQAKTIPKAGHVMHLEQGRHELYRITEQFFNSCECRTNQ